jgi:hypothetical protein
LLLTGQLASSVSGVSGLEDGESGTSCAAASHVARSEEHASPTLESPPEYMNPPQHKGGRVEPSPILLYYRQQRGRKLRGGAAFFKRHEFMQFFSGDSFEQPKRGAKMPWTFSPATTLGKVRTAIAVHPLSAEMTEEAFTVDDPAGEVRGWPG